MLEAERSKDEVRDILSRVIGAEIRYTQMMGYWMRRAPYGLVSEKVETQRGKTGQYYSYYHCDKRGHKFRVKKEELELRVLEFVGGLEFSQQDIDTLFAAIKAAYDKRLAYYDTQISLIDGKIASLDQQARSMAKNFATIAPSAQQYLNEELEDVDKQIKQLSLERMNMESKKPMNIDRVIARVKYFVENLDKLIVKQIDPVKRHSFSA